MTAFLRSLVVLMLFAAFTNACGDDAPARDAAVDTGADSVTPGDSAAPDSAADSAPEVETPDVALPPPLLTERGFVAARVIAHLHSAFSHDGCDGQGLDAAGKPNLACVQRMKRALCSEHIALAFMTDHPSFMRDQAWQDLFYYDAAAGDVLLLQDDGTPWAVRYPCGAGEGGPDGSVVLMVGFEGTHTMPLGLRRQIDWERSSAFEDSVAPEVLDALTAAVTEAGGHVAIAHSEEEELSGATIAAHDVAAMELYNFHANFNEVLGGGLGDALLALEYFLDLEAVEPDPDLTALIMLERYPLGALEKWRQVSVRRAITAFAGSDVHENASFPPICQEGTTCDRLEEVYPNLVAYLKRGGPIWQSDGERLDGYARVFRWVQNRVYLPTADAGDPAAIERAFFAGRNVVVFEVLGDASGAGLVLESPDGARYDLGEDAPLEPGATLWARSPEPPQPGSFATWTDGTSAAMESIVWRSDDSGTHEVARWTTPATWQAIPLDQPGSYQLEVLLTPHHLVDALGPAADFAATAYRWVETNAIRIGL